VWRGAGRVDAVLKKHNESFLGEKTTAPIITDTGGGGPRGVGKKRKKHLKWKETTVTGKKRKRAKPGRHSIKNEGSFKTVRQEGV